MSASVADVLPMGSCATLTRSAGPQNGTTGVLAIACEGADVTSTVLPSEDADTPMAATRLLTAAVREVERLWDSPPVGRALLTSDVVPLETEFESAVRRAAPVAGSSGAPEDSASTDETLAVVEAARPADASADEPADEPADTPGAEGAESASSDSAMESAELALSDALEDPICKLARAAARLEDTMPVAFAASAAETLEEPPTLLLPLLAMLPITCAT